MAPFLLSASSIMRILSFLALIAVALAPVPAAAQAGFRADASLQPLPALLAPTGAVPVDGGAMSPDAMELGMITGVLVGMTTGLGFAVFAADRCGVESDCTLAPEYKILIYSIIGTTLGGIIGLGTTFALGGRPGHPDAGLAAEPLDTGGMRIGVTLRH
ncbi:MAG TPA: hypothetical protein VE871_04950 [Longimicrobium sp.]|nr:hypothetical protein [Longimicrobium sp.]